MNRSAGRPLSGKRIAITRPRAQAASMASALEALGAAVLVTPMIRITDPVDREPLLDALRRLDRYDWVVFTSVNGVDRFWSALADAGRDADALGNTSICAIGPATADAIEKEGGRVDLIPAEYVAESVIDALSASRSIAGARMLLPRAEIAREVLPDALRDLGAHVDEVVAYRTVPDEEGVEELSAALARGEVDVVAFTSSSTVRNFAEMVAPDPGLAVVASIGPITSGTARELGWEVAIEATEHTTEGLVAAIADYFRTSAPT